MPDTTSQLYDANKQAKQENQDILMGQAQKDAASKREISQSPFVVPELRLGATPVEDTSAYRDYMREPGMMTSDVNTDLMRAQNQSLSQQIGHTILRAAADIPMQALGNLASIVDLEDYANADDEVGNGLTSLMTDWQEAWKAKNPIYRESPGTSFDVGDSGWWADNISNLLDSAGAFVLTGYIAGGILSKVAQGIKEGQLSAKSIAKIEGAVADRFAAGQITEAQIPQAFAELKAIEAANKMPLLDKLTGVTNAVALNQAESILEGMGVYKDVYNDNINKNKSFEESAQRAADAASLDVNINRANILLNLSSAGMFTKANKTINELYQVGKYGLKKKFVGETLQEGLEEGVNYIAQAEAMEQAKQGPAYQWDSARALRHLADPQGLEAMFLGAMGGAIQTGITEGVVGKGEDVKETVSAVNERERAANPNVPTRQERQIMQNKLVYDYYQKKMTATSPEEHAQIDNEYLHQSGPLAYVGGDLDIRLSEFERISTLSPDETVSQDEIDMAKKAVETLGTIKKAGDDITLDEQKIGKPYLNKADLINAKLVVDQAKQNLDQTESDLNKKANETTDEEQLAPYKKAVDEANNIYNKSEESYKKLSSKDTQDSIQAARDLAIQKKKDAEADKKAAQERTSKVTAKKNPVRQKGEYTFLKPVLEGPPGKTADHVHTIEDEGWHVANMDLTAERGEPSEIEDSIVKELSGDENTAIIFNHPNGEVYVVTPRSMHQPLDLTGKADMVEEPPSISAIEHGASGPLIGGAIKRLLQTGANNPDMKIAVGNATFTYKDFVNWAKDPTTKKIADEKVFSQEDIENAILGAGGPLTLKDINEFLIYMSTEDNSVSEAGEIPDPVTSIVEPENPADMESLDRDQQDSLKRSQPNAVNYAAEQFTVDVVKETGDNKKYVISGTGVINREYLINADKTKVKAGAKVYLKAHEEVVPTYDYDEQGRTIIVDGKKKTTNHNAASALAAGREIPIAIHLESTGEIIGFLGEAKWLEEGTSGDRVHLRVEDPIATDEMIAAVNAIRTEITSQYASGKKIAVATKIKSVSSGVPILNTSGPQSLEKVLPKIDKDIKDYGIDHPFAYYSAGEVWGAGKTAISNIVNTDQLLASRVNNGAVIVLLPAGNGKLYARVANSARVSENDSQHVFNGLLAAAGHADFTKATATYNEGFAKANGLESLSKAEGLRQYLQQFIFMHPANTLRDPNAMTGVKAVVVTEKNGATVIEYGRTQEGGGKVINMRQINAALKGSDKDMTADAAMKAIQELSDFIGTMKTSFDMSKVSSSTPVVGITKGGYSNVANNHLSRYMKTVQTNVRSEKNNDGKQVYLIQQVVELDVDAQSAMTEAEKAIPIATPTAPIVQQKPTTSPTMIEVKADGLVRSTRQKKNFGKSDAANNLLPDASDIVAKLEEPLKSIAVEAMPLSKVEPGDSESMGEEIKAYCKK